MWALQRGEARAPGDESRRRTRSELAAAGNRRSTSDDGDVITYR
jgi:hypothetical protein